LGLTYNAIIEMKPVTAISVRVTVIKISVFEETMNITKHCFFKA